MPCGLLYGILALAMSTHSVVLGGNDLVVFGMGNRSAMMIAGVSGRLMGLATRRWLYAVAAWCLILTGVVSVVRGVILHRRRGRADCPLPSLHAVSHQSRPIMSRTIDQLPVGFATPHSVCRIGLVRYDRPLRVPARPGR
jgi:sulfite exporter TauE/SafE